MSTRVLVPDMYRQSSESEDGLRTTFVDHLATKGDFDPVDVDKVLRPLGLLRAVILGHYELERLHSALGITDEIDEEHIEGLTAHIKGSLPGTEHDEVLAKRLPLTRLKSRARKGAGSLAIGRNPIMSMERKFGQQAALNFYNIPVVPEGVWLPDGDMACVPIIGYRSQATREIFDHLSDFIRGAERPLPKGFTLEALRIDADLYKSAIKE
jgi:hypothetical protein